MQEEKTPASGQSHLCSQVRQLMVEIGPEDLSPGELSHMIALLESARTRVHARCTTNVIELDTRRPLAGRHATPPTGELVSQAEAFGDWVGLDDPTIGELRQLVALLTALEARVSR
jgi:hypothetical protein